MALTSRKGKKKAEDDEIPKAKDKKAVVEVQNDDFDGLSREEIRGRVSDYFMRLLRKKYFVFFKVITYRSCCRTYCANSRGPQEYGL